MNKADIVDYYKRMVADGNLVCDSEYKLPPKVWHDRYKKIKEEVESIRIRLNGKGTIDEKTDKEFLEKLILAEHNGIARAKRGRLGGVKASSEDSLEIFKKLILEKNVIESLENLIKNSCGDRGQHLLHHMHPICGINQYLLVNRIIAACTEKVSSSVNGRDFVKIFKRFIKDNIISRDYQPTGDQSDIIIRWYDMNVHMMDELRIIIKKGIGKDPDPTYLSMLAWYIWDVILEKTE